MSWSGGASRRTTNGTSTGSPGATRRRARGRSRRPRAARTRDGRIDPALKIGDVLGIQRQPRRELSRASAWPRRAARARARAPPGSRGRSSRARRRPSRRSRRQQARKVVEGEVRRRLHVPAGAEQDARHGDRPEMVVEGRLLVCSHPRTGLGAEVLDDDLLDVPVLVAERLQGEEGVDPLLARLADADEDPARERDRELAGETDRLSRRAGSLSGEAQCGPPFSPSRSAVVSSMIPIEAETGRSASSSARVMTPGLRCGSSPVSSSTSRAQCSRYSSVVSQPSARSSSRATL